MDITKWYERIAGSQSINAIAGLAGLNQSTLNRQLRAGRLEPELVVAIARAMKADVLDALVIQGLLTSDDVDKHAPRKALNEATDEEIVEEVSRRLGNARTAFDVPLSPSGGVFEVYDGNSQPPERRAAKKLDVGAEQGTPDDLGEDSQIPLEDWDE